ncbi:hypothetical protein ACWFMI_15025 [Nocardiopsis terrae]
MTPQQVRSRVAAIDPADEDAAHAAEDLIWQDTLAAIAAGAHKPRQLAKEALATALLDFPRYCA